MTTETYEGLRRELDQVDRRVGQLEDHQRAVTVDAISRVVFEAVDRLRLEIKEDIKKIPTGAEVKVMISDGISEGNEKLATRADVANMIHKELKDVRKTGVSNWLAFGGVLAGFALVIVEWLNH